MTKTNTKMPKVKLKTKAEMPKLKLMDTERFKQMLIDKSGSIANFALDCGVVSETTLRRAINTGYLSFDKGKLISQYLGITLLDMCSYVLSNGSYTLGDAKKRSKKKGKKMGKTEFKEACYELNQSDLEIVPWLTIEASSDLIDTISRMERIFTYQEPSRTDRKKDLVEAMGKMEVMLETLKYRYNISNKDLKKAAYKALTCYSE